ncbi:MAG: nucleotidyltransferase domain-containing protein [Synergistaceae bacterium]
MSYSSTYFNIPSIDIDRIIDLCDISEKRIWNIYLYGSQVYGNQTELSDFDFLVVASSMDRHKEFNDNLYNVHINTPDFFEGRLSEHQMGAIECIYAPSFAIIQEKRDFNFEIDPVKLKRKSLSESYNAFNRGKLKIMDGDMERGIKSLWHSMRILMFASQILSEGTIYDFSEANNLWSNIEESDYVKWEEFKSLVLPYKRILENIVRDSRKIKA